MAIVPFDSTVQLHHNLFSDFKKDLLLGSFSQHYLYAQYIDYIDEIDVVLRDIAVEELELDSELDDHNNAWKATIIDYDPTSFKIIIGLDFIDFETESIKTDFVKAEGQVFIEDDERIILNIDPYSLDYSSYKEFKKNNNNI